MKKFTLLMAAFSLVASAKSVQYGYGEGDYAQWGAKTAQLYDIAVKFDAQAVVGSTITAVDVPVLTDNEIGDYSIWLSSDLKLEKDASGKKVNAPDIMSVKVTPESVDGALGFIHLDIPEGYVIPDSGVYVGYSFNVSSASDDNDRYPVVCYSGDNPGAFYVHSGRTYRSWKDVSSSLGISAAVTIWLTGNFHDDAASLVSIPELYVLADQTSKAEIVLANHGANPVETFTYSIDVDGKPALENAEYKFATPIAPRFDLKASAEVDIPAAAYGSHTYQLKITEINGRPNLDPQNSASARFEALNTVPVKRPIMEEMTGLWCGWCPRGFVALEKMNELHPDFVAVSYHGGDQMAVEYPALVEGFPGAVMDRGVSMDPYSGISEEPFGIEKMWEGLKKEFAPAEIEVTGEWVNDSIIEAVSTVSWAVSPVIKGEYRVEYVLVSDSLSDPLWQQHNYYATITPDKGGIYMENFCLGGKYGRSDVAGLVFNDVVVATSGLTGVKGSVTETEARSVNEHKYRFNIARNSIIQNKKNLRLVAMLLVYPDGQRAPYGVVVNSNKGLIYGEVAAVGSITSDAEETVDVKYYDLSGREVENPAHGIYIRKDIKADGTANAIKVALN